MHSFFPSYSLTHSLIYLSLTLLSEQVICSAWRMDKQSYDNSRAMNHRGGDRDSSSGNSANYRHTAGMNMMVTTGNSSYRKNESKPVGPNERKDRRIKSYEEYSYEKEYSSPHTSHDKEYSSSSNEYSPNDSSPKNRHTRNQERSSPSPPKRQINNNSNLE